MRGVGWVWGGPWAQAAARCSTDGSMQASPAHLSFSFLVCPCVCVPLSVCAGGGDARLMCLVCARFGALALFIPCFSPNVGVLVAPRPLCPSLSPQPLLPPPPLPIPPHHHHRVTNPAPLPPPPLASHQGTAPQPAGLSHVYHHPVPRPHTPAPQTSRGAAPHPALLSLPVQIPTGPAPT